MTLEILVDGVDITDDVIIENARFTMANGPSPGDFEFRVKDPDKTYAFRAGHGIIADFEGNRCFDGFVTHAIQGHGFPVDDTVTEGPEAVERVWTLQGVDVNILFRRRFIFNQADPSAQISVELPPGTSDLVYLDAIMDHLTIGDDNLVREFYHVASPNPDRKGIAISIGDSWEHAFALAAAIPGAIWGIRPSHSGSRFDQTGFDADGFSGAVPAAADRVVYWEDDDTETAAFAISDEPDDVTSFGYANFEWLEDGSKMVNDAQIWGVGLGKSRLTYARVTDEASIAEHGRWENGNGWRYNLYRQSSVDRVANSLVYGSPANLHGAKDPSIRVTCRVRQPGLVPGDKVRIISNVFDEEIVLPIRRLTTTFVDRDTALFDLEATWDIDAPLGLFDFPPFPDFPGFEIPPTDIEIPSRCIDGGLLWADGSGWRKRRSDPRLGTVVALSGDPGHTGFSTIRRYWNEFVPVLGFGPTEGMDTSELYVHFSKTLPWAANVPWGMRFTFTSPLALNPSEDEHHAPFIPFGPHGTGASLAQYPTGALDLTVASAVTAGWHEFTFNTARLMFFRDGSVYVGGHSVAQTTGGSYTFERTPDGQMYVYPSTEVRPAGAGNISTNYTGGNLYGGAGLSVRKKHFYEETPNFPVVVIAFQLIEDVGEESISTVNADSDGHATQMERFLHEGTGTSFPVGHNRLPAPFAASVYRRDTDEFGNGGASSSIYDSYLVSWQVSNIVFYQSNTIIEAVDCVPIVAQPEGGLQYGQTPTRVSDTTFQTSFPFVPGSSQVTVDGIQMRLGVDYVENFVEGTIIFLEPVPASSTVYIYYETLT